MHKLNNESHNEIANGDTRMPISMHFEANKKA